MRVSIFRRAHFNAAHQLWVKDWSAEENLKKFGKCANPNYHGHNYDVEVCVTGEVDPVTGMVIDLADLKRLIEREIEYRFDHKNLNVDCPEFDHLIPSAEHIAYVIYGILREQLEDRLDLMVRLYETPRNFVEYPARG